MPSRPISSDPKDNPPILKTHVALLAITISATLIVLITIIYIAYRFWYTLFHHSRTNPFDSTLTLTAPLKLHRFTYKELKSATNQFNQENAIGKGGSGTVFRGILKDGKSVAVKKLDISSSSSSCLQPEREFQNELTILGAIRSPFIVSLLGYCVEKNKRLLVYEYMPNRSLQELLFTSSVAVGGTGGGVSSICSSSSSCLSWEIRFQAINDVACALEFLHNQCHPPVIHGDVKPSNVLLDWEFRAKVSDFGLSRFKVEDEEVEEGDFGADMFSQDLWKSQELSGNLNFDTPPTATPPIDGGSGNNNNDVDFALALQASTSSRKCRSNQNITLDLSPTSCGYYSNGGGGSANNKCTNNSSSSPKGKEVIMTVDDEELYSTTVEHSKELDLSSPSQEPDDQTANAKQQQWGKDWWWKQDGSGELCSKDYVTEWIGSQIHPSANPDWGEPKLSSLAEEDNNNTLEDHHQLDNLGKDGSSDLFPMQPLRFESVDKRAELLQGEKMTRGKKTCKKKPRKMHEWWKEENLEEEMSKRGSKRMTLERKMKKSFIRWPRCFKLSSRRRCLIIQRMKFMNPKSGRNECETSGEFSFRKGWKKKKKRSQSMGSEMWSGDLFSRELSSTTSMRGTLCYVAPEYGGCGYLMEKADIYSLGVLILVIVSGRRPLHVLNSPMKLEKANLISWCRQLAQAGNVLELIDERLKDSYNKEQASLCINLGLACLQRMPELRPDIGDIVRILRGEMELPPLPFEFSPSPPSRLFSSRSKKKHKAAAE